MCASRGSERPLQKYLKEALWAFRRPVPQQAYMTGTPAIWMPWPREDKSPVPQMYSTITVSPSFVETNESRFK